MMIENMENPGIKGKWQFEMDREASRYTIRFNHPDDKPVYIGNPELKNNVTIDSKKTVQDLKALISKKLDIPEDEFLLKRG